MKKAVRLSEKDRSATKEFYERISKLLGADLKKVLLFGSKVKGGSTAESDIDVLALVQDCAMPKRHQIRGEAYEVNLKYGVYISPRIISLSTYEHPVWKITPFIKTLKAQGVPL